MDDVAPVIDEGEALRTHFIGSNDITAAPGRAQKGETDGGTEQGEKDAVLAFNTMKACFEVCEGGCVHDGRYCKGLINKLFVHPFGSAARVLETSKPRSGDARNAE